MFLVELYKDRVVLNKPIQIGFSILDMSKTYMFDFYYNKLEPQYGYENIKLLFTDTDSICV